MMPQKHLYPLSQMAPDEVSAGGTRTRVDKKKFQALQGMSIYKLELEPNGIREPHWHANADELGYCISGQVLVHLYDTSDAQASFLVSSGQSFLIPSGALHAIENKGEAKAQLILSFSNEEVEDFNLSSTLNVFSNAVLGNTWGVNAKVMEGLKRSSISTFAGIAKEESATPDYSRYSSPYRFDLEGSQPILTNEGGAARMARQSVWPILQRQALYSLILTDVGMREPHWHPETAELGYVHKGKGRMTIYSPSGSIDTYLLEVGNIYFIPKAYPHHIENLTKEDLHLLIFFDQAMPRDIGFTGSIRSFSNEVLGASTGTDSVFFSRLTKYFADLFIVKRINPLD